TVKFKHFFETKSCQDSNVSYEVITEQGEREFYTARNCDITTFNSDNCEVLPQGAVKCPELVLGSKNCTTIAETLYEGPLAIPRQEYMATYCKANPETIARGGEFEDVNALNHSLQTAAGAGPKSSITTDATGKATQHIFSDSFVSFAFWTTAFLKYTYDHY